jgi:hypothetical protein
MGFQDWFKKNSDELKKKAKEEYSELKEDYNKLTDKAEKAQFEDKLASNFIEDDFVKAVLTGQIVFTFVGKKSVKSLLDNHEKSIWQSGFECFEYIIHHTTNGDLMEFKINHRQERMINIFRLNNVIRHGVDKNDAEPNMMMYTSL